MREAQARHLSLRRFHLCPLKKESCTFLFDRGCLQTLPKTTRSFYLQEVAQTLKPGGVFQLWAKDLSLFDLEKITPAFLKSIALEQFPFKLNDGSVQQITHAIFRKQ